MQNPKIVLECLNKNKTTVSNLYHNLYNKDFYILAYNNIYPGKELSQNILRKIDTTIEKLRGNTYQPTKINSTTTSVRVEDKLVQEIIRLLLSATYESQLPDCVHSYRPNRSVHTALDQVRKTFQGTKWWIVGDISKIFTNIDHTKLIQILTRRIKEQKFLTLINKFLKAGYLEYWKYDKTYSGTPVGSIFGGILTNIYLKEFDEYMINKCNEFWKGKRRAPNNEYHRLVSLQHLWKKTHPERIDELKKQIHREQNKNGTQDVFDPNYRRLFYHRYSNQILIGVVSTKREAIHIQENTLTQLIKTTNVNLEINNTFSFYHNTDLIRFLRYDLSIMRSISRDVNGKVGLWIPYKVCVDFIRNNRLGKFVCDNITGKPKLKALSRPELSNASEIEILFIYNTMMRGLYDYYIMSSNVCKLNGFGHICETSFLKTLSCKYKTNCAKLYRNKKYNHRVRGKSVVGITTQNGTFYEYFDGPFTTNKKPKFNANVDIIKNTHMYTARTDMLSRQTASKCEMCGNTTGPFELHHINKLKNIDKNRKHEQWEKLKISRERSTIVLCRECHLKIHRGNK